MVKTILNMLWQSNYKFFYFLIILIPSIFLNIHIYNTLLNFPILLFVCFIPTFVSLIITIEILIEEEGTKIFDYLILMKSENYVMVYRTLSIFAITAPITIVTSLIENTIYFTHVNIVQQLIYVVLILISNLFYIYFLQYVTININNMLLRNSIIISVTGISMLSLMTRSLPTYLMFITMIGLFFAVTFMNRRFSEEFKRNEQ